MAVKVSKNLRRLRKAQKKTQEQLAAAERAKEAQEE